VTVRPVVTKKKLGIGTVLDLVPRITAAQAARWVRTVPSYMLVTEVVETEAHEVDRHLPWSVGGM
jgi:hypothetical protein